MNKLAEFISKQLTTISQRNPLIAFTKPLIVRVLNNNLYKVERVLKQISDQNGLVDIEGILGEMINNLVSCKPFKIDTGFLGELEIGNGKIKANVPFVNQDLILTSQDITELKDMLVSNMTNE